MDHAPLASALGALLAGLTHTVAEELDAGAVHQQIQRPDSATIQDLDLESLLPGAQREVIRNWSIQTGQAEQADEHPGGLPERKLEKILRDKQNWIAAFEKNGGRNAWH